MELASFQSDVINSLFSRFFWDAQKFALFLWPANFLTYVVQMKIYVVLHVYGFEETWIFFNVVDMLTAD